MLVERLLSPWVYQNEDESHEAAADSAAVESAPEVDTTPDESLDLNKLLNDALDEIEAENAPIQPEAEEPGPSKERGTDGKFKAKEPEATDDVEPETVEADEPSDDAKALAAKYGLPVAEVTAFPDVDTARRAFELSDRQLLAAARREQAQTPAPTPEKPATAPTVPAWAEVQKKLEDADIAPEVIETIKANYEHNALVEQRAAKVETELNQFKSLLHEKEQQAVRERELHEQTTFINHLDSHGHGDLFGSPKGVDETQKQNATAVFQTMKVLQQQLIAAGRDATMNESLVERAIKATFPEQIVQKERAALGKKVKEQSRKVMGTGQRSTHKKSVPWDGPEEENPIYKEFFKSIEENTWKAGALKP